MRNIALGLIVLSVVGGLVAGCSVDSDRNKKKNDDREPVFNGRTSVSTKLKILQAGYVMIPEKDCNTNNISGTIRIILPDLLTDLKENHTVTRKISYFKAGDGRVDDPNQVGEPLAIPPQEAEVNGFPTALDFHTVLANGDLLVKPNLNVIVRVVLPTGPNINEQLDFMRRDAPRAEISDFAVVRSWGTPRKMFCGRQPIKTLPTSPGHYVEFQIQSVAGPTSPAPSAGGFGIGLLVRNLNDKTVVPIILDPNDRNKG